MNVVVTGAAGFIGGNFVRRLVETRPEYRVTAVDCLTYAGNYSTIADLVEAGRVTFVKEDVADAEAMERTFRAASPRLVFHLAAESHVDRSIESAAAFVRTNVVGTQTLLTAFRAGGGGTFVHVSTDEVYGSLGKTGTFTETTPLDPSSPYAASKAASDLLALAYYKTHGLDVRVTRCTNNYGPYQFPEKFIPLFVTSAMRDEPLPLYGDGSNVRSWIHVVDHCDALVRVAEAGRPGEVYNIGAGPESEAANRDVAYRILDLLGKPRTLVRPVADRPGHDWRYAVDPAKAERELGWKAATRFDDGLAATVAWYRENEAWWQAVKTGEYLEFYGRNYGARPSTAADSAGAATAGAPHAPATAGGAS